MDRGLCCQDGEEGHATAGTCGVRPVRPAGGLPLPGRQQGGPAARSSRPTHGLDAARVSHVGPASNELLLPRERGFFQPRAMLHPPYKGLQLGCCEALLQGIKATDLPLF